MQDLPPKSGKDLTVLIVNVLSLVLKPRDILPAKMAPYLDTVKVSTQTL